ncbi:hypothetical protein [Microbacterium aurugineum]
MIEVTIPLNTSRESKNVFLAEWLIPYLARSQARYFVVRRVIEVPVFLAYIDRPDEDVETVRMELVELLTDFVTQLRDEDRTPAAHYEDMWEDVRKIHRYERQPAASSENGVVCRTITHIKRTGHYYRPEDVEIFNYFAFRAQPLLERSLFFLQEDRRRREIPFIFSLFAVASSQFESGYLSFKSHVLGFFSYRHPVLPRYLEAFATDFERSTDALRALRVRAEAAAADPQTPPARLEPVDSLADLISSWSALLAELRAALYAVREKPQRSFFRSVKAQVDYFQFRRLSDFHRTAFSRRGQRIISSRGFGAYRMCVNFVYLLLPTLGISSRKRVEAAYLLVRSIELPHDFLPQSNARDR